MKHMRGWKTWAGGVIAVGVGLYLVVFQPERFEFGAGLMSLGFIGMGIGHKIEKAGK